MAAGGQSGRALHPDVAGQFAPLTEDPTGALRDVRPWILFCVCVLCWLIYLAIVAPPYAGVDTFLFRDPGCAVAAGQGLVSRSVPHGGEHVTPELFAAYTPGAPLLFGWAASIFGCTPDLNKFYNLFFAVLISVLTLIALFRAVLRPAVRMLLAAVVGLLLPSGVFFNEFDRPEIPAFCLLVGLLLCWQRTVNMTAKSLLMGLSGSSSFFIPGPA